jgi:hypothetical protein
MLRLQHFSIAFLILSILSCMEKKKQPTDLGSWLESHFPGQLVVVNNIVNLDPKNLFYKKTETIVADKQDPEVQIKVTWYKAQEGLGLNAEEIQSALDDSRRNVAAARALYSLLGEKGLDRISVGVIDMAAYILTFEEPSPSMRKKYLEQILAALHSRSDATQTSIWIECMEPLVYQEYFKNIIPSGYWNRGGTYHEDKKIMSLDFEWSPDSKAADLMPHWAINAASARSAEYMETSYAAASAWAAKHLSAPYYLEPAQWVRYDVDTNDPLAIHYHFPYYASKPDTSAYDHEAGQLGFVSGIYQTDQKSFSKIKLIKEL